MNSYATGMNMNSNQPLTNDNSVNENTPLPIKEEEQVIQPEAIQVPKRAPRVKFGVGVPIHCNKFSEADKSMMVSWMALGFTRSEIQERAREELNVEISQVQLYKYYTSEKWKPLIQKIRNDNMNDIASVAGSHKKVRLDRAERIFDKALKRNKFKEALSATEHQRKEMEGAGDMVNLTMNQFNVYTDDELEHKKKEVLERIKLISDHKEKKL